MASASWLYFGQHREGVCGHGGGDRGLRTGDGVLLTLMLYTQGVNLSSKSCSSSGPLGSLLLRLCKLSQGRPWRAVGWRSQADTGGCTPQACVNSANAADPSGPGPSKKREPLGGSFVEQMTLNRSHMYAHLAHSRCLARAHSRLSEGNPPGPDQSGTCASLAYCVSLSCCVCV